MDVMNTALYLIINAFHVYIFFLAYRIFFGRSKVPTYIETLCYVLFYAANSVAFLVVGNPFLNLATSVLPLLALTHLYLGRPRAKLLIGVFICVVSMLLESGSLSVMLMLKLDVIIKNQIIGNLTSDIILFLVVLIYGKVRQSKISGHVSLLHWFSIIVLPTGSMAIIMLVYAAEYSALTNIIIVALLVCMNVLVFQLYGLLDNHYSLRYEHTLLLRQNEAYAHEFELIQKNDETIRIVRHDLRNHVVTMTRLLEHNELSKLGQYLANLSGHFISRKKYVSSGNPEVDSILNYKLATVEALGAKLDVEVRVPTQLTLPANDLSAILGNLLDNAVDALADCPEKYLKVCLCFDRGVLFIRTSNSYAGELKKAMIGGKTAYLSRKSNSDAHGIGLSSVERTIERYDGVMEIGDGGHHFVVSIMLYLPT